RDRTPAVGRASVQRGASAQAASVRARQAEHVLAEVGEDEVVRDRCDGVQARLAELALDVVLLCEAEAAVGVETRVGRLPRRLRRQQLREVRLGSARLPLLE